MAEQMGRKPQREHKSRRAELLTLFWVLFKTGTFTLGGGYAMIPLLESEFIQKHRWLDENTFLDMLAVAQAAPGPMAVNMSVYLGFHLFGKVGALVALMASALPSLLLLTIIGLYFTKLKDRFQVIERMFQGVGPAVAGTVFASAVGLLKRLGTGLLPAIILMGGIFAVTVMNVSPVWVIACAGALGIVSMLFERRRTS